MAASIRLSRTLLRSALVGSRCWPLPRPVAVRTSVAACRFISTGTFNFNERANANVSTDKQPERREFQAETRMLLDIVAKSLYSEKEVFIRELISNASDALEKFRYLSLTGDQLTNKDRALEITITTDKVGRTITIQDSGIGMTREEAINNLGTIARSGSKAFVEKLKSSGQSADQASGIIGQFGVGFYSAFMVADRVDVYTKSSQPDSPGLHWSSDGSGTYELTEADGVEEGTKIVIKLKEDCSNFADEDSVKGYPLRHISMHLNNLTVG